MRTTLRQTATERKSSRLQDSVARGSANKSSKVRGQSKALSGQTGHSSPKKVEGTKLNVDHYTFRVFWSPEDREYVGSCAEFSSLSHLDETPEAAFQGIRKLVKSVIGDLTRSGDPVPRPISERTYSGAFKVRVPPGLHRRLVIEAAEEGVSLNRLVSAKLAFHLEA
jgi:predicted HicB family RNase H-like nuclease